MWDIYSIGDAAYLAAVLNAVAMLSGSGNMHALAGIGSLVGFMLIILHILQGVRKTTLSMTALGAANARTAGADMTRTFVNYLSECTLYGFNNGTRSADDVLRNPIWRTALGSTLVVPTTELWIGSNPVTKECPDAWTDLSNYVTTQYVPKLQASVTATLRIANPNDVPDESVPMDLQWADGDSEGVDVGVGQHEADGITGGRMLGQRHRGSVRGRCVQ
jgi:hypothetical protein